MKKEGLRVLATIPAAPTTLYLAWLSSEQHSAMTGSTAKIDPTVGAKYTVRDGYISGKLVALDLGRRIVMSWRTTDFPRDAPDSRVEVYFEALGGSTRVTVLQTDVPEGQAEKYKTDWMEKYFNPMRTFFSKYLPDPRKPPPPRRPIPPPDEDEEEEEETPKMKGKLKGGKPVAPPAKPTKPGKDDAKAPAKRAPVAPPPPPPPPASKKKPTPPPPASKKPAPPPPASKKPAPPSKKPAAKAPPPKPAGKAPAKPAPKKPAPKKKR